MRSASGGSSCSPKRPGTTSGCTRIQCAAAGPSGRTIAHGYLTLPLGTALSWEVLDVTDADQVINYGLAKVRFPSPVPNGAILDMTVDLVSVVA